MSRLRLWLGRLHQWSSKHPRGIKRGSQTGVGSFRAEPVHRVNVELLENSMTMVSELVLIRINHWKMGEQRPKLTQLEISADKLSTQITRFETEMKWEGEGSGESVAAR